MATVIVTVKRGALKWGPPTAPQAASQGDTTMLDAEWAAELAREGQVEILSTDDPAPTPPKRLRKSGGLG